MFARSVRLGAGGPVFSFTFDDAPRSAGERGAALVEAAGGRATFYLSGRLAEQPDHLNLAEGRELAARGHHVGCHSHGHVRAAGRSALDIRWDAARNRDDLATALAVPVEDYAWPYGEVVLGAKRHLARAYRSLRTTHPGVNAGRFDLAGLRAVPLYGAAFGRETIARFIELAVARRGWLIFYTHGVTPEAQPGGTSEADLTWLLERCAARGPIQSVRSVREERLVAA